MRKLLAAGAAAVALAGCDDRPDQWDAYIYPDRYDLSEHEVLKGFKTFDLCQQAAIVRLRSLPDPSEGDYECGYKCGPMDEYGGMTICKEARK